MNKRDERELGGAWAGFQQLWSGPAADPAVRYWAARWDLRGQDPYRQKIIPYPDVHLTFPAEGPPVVTGPQRRYVIRVLRGRDSVFGVAFTAGSFRAYLKGPVSHLTGRSVPAAEIFGSDLPATDPDPEAMSAALDAFLAAVPPRVNADAHQAVTAVRTDPTIKRVDELALRTGLTERQLQRLFAEHVGLPPKWVIRRYRLHEVSERLAAGGKIDWAQCAAELGYADQAHLSRDFTDLAGESPTAYARRYPSA